MGGIICTTLELNNLAFPGFILRSVEHPWILRHLNSLALGNIINFSVTSMPDRYKILCPNQVDNPPYWLRNSTSERHTQIALMESEIQGGAQEAHLGDNGSELIHLFQ